MLRDCLPYACLFACLLAGSLLGQIILLGCERTAFSALRANDSSSAARQLEPLRQRAAAAATYNIGDRTRWALQAEAARAKWNEHGLSAAYRKGEKNLRTSFYATPKRDPAQPAVALASALAAASSSASSSSSRTRRSSSAAGDDESDDERADEVDDEAEAEAAPDRDIASDDEAEAADEALPTQVVLQGCGAFEQVFFCPLDFLGCRHRGYRSLRGAPIQSHIVKCFRKRIDDARSSDALALLFATWALQPDARPSVYEEESDRIRE